MKRLGLLFLFFVGLSAFVPSAQAQVPPAGNVCTLMPSLCSGQAAQPTSIFGYKYEDKNSNRTKDSDELGLNGWSILLLDESSKVVARTQTYFKSGLSDPGYYEFTHLDRTKRYRVVEEPQDGWDGPTQNDSLATLTERSSRNLGNFSTLQKLRFCVRDASDTNPDSFAKRPVAGAIIDIKDDFNRDGQDDNSVIKSDSPLFSNANHAYPHIQAGPDGCTNPHFINYATLRQRINTPIDLVATHPDYQTKQQSWQWENRNEEQIVYVLLAAKSNVAATVQFCVRDAGTQSPLVGAAVEVPARVVITSAPLLTALTTQNEACTDTALLNYGALESAKQQNQVDYVLDASHGDYVSKNQTWRYAGVAGQKVYVDLTAQQKDGSSIGSVTKVARPDRLVGDETTATVEVTFTVRIVGGKPVKGVVIHERLADKVTFANPANIKVKDPSRNELSISPTPSNNRSVDVPLGDLTTAGSYVLSFDITYSGAVQDGVRAIDAVNANECDRPANQRSGSWIEYTNGNNQAACQRLEAGSIQRDSAKLTINGDAWFADQSVAVGDRLAVGSGSVIVSGKGITTNGAQNFLGIPNYARPSSGKAVWANIEKQMQQRVTRAIQSGVAVPRQCEDGQTLALDFSGTAKVIVLQNRSDRGRGCHVTIPESEIKGTGTVINQGGNLEIVGRIRPGTDAKHTFGYIALKRNGQGADVTVRGEVSHTAIFTNGQITLAGDSARSLTHRAKFIAQKISFPTILDRALTLDRADAVTQNPPPLFEQFYLPQGREVP